MTKTKKKSIAKRILTFSISNTIFIGIVLITSGYFLQSNILMKSFHKQSTQLTETWAKKLNMSDVNEARKATEYDDPAQQKLTEIFDNLSASNPNIAQGYIYGTELKDGNKTSVIAFPSHVIESFKEAGIKLGDMYEQPKGISDSIKSMLETKEITYSKIYHDDFGTWMSILYPLKDSNGQISAYFAVDVDASPITSGQKLFITYSVISTLFITLILTIFQYLFIKKNLSPLNELVTSIDKISAGNFDILLTPGNDELGIVNRKFNTMANKMKEMINKVKETSHNVDAFSKELLDLTCALI